jgi:hypothetical protein
MEILAEFFILSFKAVLIDIEQRHFRCTSFIVLDIVI